MFEITPEQEQELLGRLNMMLESGSSKADIDAYNQKYRRENGREKKNLVGNDLKVGTQDISPSKSPSKSTFGGSKFSLDPTNLLNREQEEPLLPQPSKKVITPENLKAQKSFEQNLFGISKYGNKTLRIDRNEIDNNGVEIVEEIEIDPRTIPVSPFTTVTDDVFLGTIRLKILENKPLTKQEQVFINQNKNPVSKFTADDDKLLQSISGELGLAVEAISDAKVPDLIGAIFPQIQGKTFGDIASSNEGRYSQIQIAKEKLKRDIEQAENVTTGATGQMKDTQKIAALNEQLDDLYLLEGKVSRKLAKIGDAEVEGIKRTDNTGNNWERFKKVVGKYAFMANAFISDENNEDIELRLSKFPSQLVTGLNYTQYIEPVEFERVSKALAEGKPISETQIANLINIGIDIEKERLKEDFNELKIDKPTFDAKILELSNKSYDNLVGNKEVLRSYMASEMAEVLDKIETSKIQNNIAGSRELGQVFGMRWNYTDDELDYASKVVAKASGLNIDDSSVKEAVQYLKDNEGAMIMQNSISKQGLVRNLFKGAAQPIRGIVSTVEGLGKTDEEIYAEGQSQGNINVSEAPIKRIADSWEGTAGKIFEGVGQLATQAGLSYLTGGAIGGVGKAILGRGGVAAIQGDIALADMAAADLAGAGLYKGREFISTFVTTFASTYDGNKKQAQTYTSDDGKATAIAGSLSGVEALAENVLSPLDIVRGVGKSLFGQNPTQKIINILDDTKILDKKSAVQEFYQRTLKAGFASGKMVATEISEEQIAALADYGANAMFNPNSKSFKNRVLKEEMLETSIETGLAMVIPALFTGVGAFNANTFAKGSLIIAAQNRQMMVDALDKNLANKLITQDEYNKKIQIVNSAAKANEELPLKADGIKLDSEQKANYIYSRVSEGALERKMEASNDVAEKAIIKEKITEQQKFREKILKTPTNVQSETTQNVSTQTQDNEGQQGQINQAQNATLTQDAEIIADEGSAVATNPALADVESTTKALRDNEENGGRSISSSLVDDKTFDELNSVNGMGLNEIFSEAYHRAKKDNSNPELVKAVEDLITSIPKTKTQTNEQEKETNTNEMLGGVREERNENERGQEGQQLRQEEMTVAQLRAEEQKELAAAIPNIESYKVDGKVDKALITDPTELATYNEIFDRYDKAITPKLEEEQRNEEVIKVNELVGNAITYKGQRATIVQDGQALVVKINGSNREYELGNVNEVGNVSIKEFGIEQEQTVVGVNESDQITVRDTPFVNNFSSPLQAINYDENGNVVSVNLETVDGKKRTFRGNVAEDIAYQISLKEINKNNETREQFEQFATNDATVAAEINDGENAVATQAEADANNQEVSRTAAERNFAEEIISDDAYNNFIDKNIVDNDTIVSIANKVKNREQLSERENAIFVGKTAEVNKSISELPVKATAQETPQSGSVVGGKKDYEMSSSEYEAERQLSIPIFNKARNIANKILNWSGTDGLYEKYLKSIGVKDKNGVYEDTSINDIDGYMKFLLKEKADFFTKEDYNTYLKYQDFMDRGILPDWQNHETKVSIALSEGKKVPNEVLKEYPELSKAQSLKETPQSSETTTKEEVEQQIEDFGVAKKDVGAVYNVISQVFQSLKNAGLTALKNVGEWVGIGKGDEKVYALKIDGVEIQVRSLGVDVVNGFYSPLEKIIKEAKVDKLPAKQWSERYANSEEARVTGLRDWLSKQQGSVSKADIQQYLKDNRIEISEIVKGMDEGKQEERARFIKREFEKNGYEITSGMDGEIEVTKDDELIEDIEDELSPELYKLAEEYFNLKSNDGRLPESATKFSRYQLQGEKENYKEVLVTLPRKLKSEGRTIYSVYDKNDGSLIGEYSGRFAADAVAKRENGRVSESKREEIGYEDTSFKSSHYDEPNILVHLRMNTRTDADGNKVLFLEEIQSDWGQKGKKEGFVQEVEKTKWKEPRDVNGNKVYDSEKGDYFIIDKGNGNVSLLNKDSEEIYDGKYKSVEEAKKAVEGEASSFGQKGTPSAPFVMDTNDWAKLGLKVALKEAVRQGEQMQRTAFEKLVDEKMDWVEARMKKLGKLEIKCP